MASAGPLFMRESLPDSPREGNTDVPLGAAPAGGGEVKRRTAWRTDQPFASPMMFFSASAISWTSSCPAATFMTVSYTASFAAVVA